MSDLFSWGHDALALEFSWSADSAPALASVRGAGNATIELPRGLPLVDILTADHGHALASARLVHTSIGEALRYVSHDSTVSDEETQLVLTLADPTGSVIVSLELASPLGVAAFTSMVRVRNTSNRPVVLRQVTSWSAYFGHTVGGASTFDNWDLVHGSSDWLGEGRWSTDHLRGLQFPEIAADLTGHNPRGELAYVSSGTWSTGKYLPVAMLVSPTDKFAWGWEIEHNGAWRWEIGEDTADGYFSVSGPTDLNHQWTEILQPGEEFSTVPVTIVAAGDLTGVAAELTRFRRARRRPHPDNTAMPVVFNDYMNTLNGDPSTELLLPLIDAAARVGAETFCIDAGWYDDGHDWWDSVGEWTPSIRRFQNGLGEVIDRIRAAGMTPGLWLEPEVVGVRSPMAARLPEAAFLSRHGQRIIEHDRYHLDLRHPAAIAHLDSVVDRLVTEFGIGFFKLDYNINPGPGTDIDADSVGAGLLGHNRAHLAWLDSVLTRHPTLVLENCGSGAMRTDFAMLSRLQLQSTSDQQDFRKYPPIAAAAPLSMLPEQAANWAYPQPEMNDEDVAFCLATGLLGRIYLSGYLNRMRPAQLALVSEAVAANKTLRSAITSATPFWPRGLPAWTDAWTTFGLATETSSYITVWNRSADPAHTTLSLPDLTGADLSVRTVFPLNLPEWTTRWDSTSGILHVHNPTGSRGARTFQLDPTPAVAE